MHMQIYMQYIPDKKKTQTNPVSSRFYPCCFFGSDFGKRISEGFFWPITISSIHSTEAWTDAIRDISRVSMIPKNQDLLPRLGLMVPIQSPE